MSYELLQLLVWALAVLVLILLAFLLFRKYFMKLGPSIKPEPKRDEWSEERLATYYQDLLNRLGLIHVDSQSSDAVPMQTLEKVADVHAAEIWGNEVSRGKPVQIIDQEGEPVEAV